ncbi:DnaT-like ssDNA-binding protein [Xanthobacter autotrophicus]|uniref:DnaT-like ssDNA-binding protein n=1 Tax=Xanthobacter autotrophicus TaxID=280 RepID=UPI00372B7C47
MLIVEDGTGIAGAESYAAVAYADAYWAARPQDALAAAWAAATEASKEGALRAASAYLDAIYGASYRGIRKGWEQGLEWPRTGGLDAAGSSLPVLGPGNVPLPALPPMLKRGAAELAPRALSGPLALDADRGGRVKREKLEGAVEIEYFDGAPAETSYGVVTGMLGPILDGLQGGQATWYWA